MDYFRGIKAGLVAGFSWAIITALLGLPSSSSSSDAFVVLVLLPAIRVVYGLIFGIIFAAVADKFLMTRSYMIKGIVFGLALSIIEFILNLFALTSDITSFVGNLIIGIASSLFFGSVLGYSYGKFARKDSPKTG